MHLKGSDSLCDPAAGGMAVQPHEFANSARFPGKRCAIASLSAGVFRAHCSFRHFQRAAGIGPWGVVPVGIDETVVGLKRNDWRRKNHYRRRELLSATHNEHLMNVETFKIVQTGSPIRRHHRQRETLIGLGRSRVGHVAEVPNARATWGMIAKVRHLVQVVGEHQFEEHRLADRHINDEDANERLVRNLIFEPRRIKAEDIPEDASKTPDFRLLKDGALRAYCEMKAPTDGDLFDVPDDLAPGEVRAEVRKDPAIFNLARRLAKAAKQFDAANPDRAHPNIPIFVNHARRKGPADLRRGFKRPTAGASFLSSTMPTNGRCRTTCGKRRAASTSMCGSIRRSGRRSTQPVPGDGRSLRPVRHRTRQATRLPLHGSSSRFIGRAR